MKYFWNTKRCLYDVKDQHSFFPISRESEPEILINPRFLTIESSGKVYWYQRVKLLTPCTGSGNLTCPVTFGSMQFPSSELDFDQIYCDYSNSTKNSRRFNVTSVEKEEVTEELPGVPFTKKMIRRGSCTASLSIDSKPMKKQEEDDGPCSTKKASIQSSSGSVITNFGVILIASLSSMVMINER